MKILLSLFIIINTLFAINLKPTITYNGSGSITDIIQNNDLLYGATDQGVIDIFNLKTNKLQSQIKLPKIKDFMDDDINAKVFSIDLYKDNMLIVSQGKDGFRNVFIHNNKQLTPIITHEKKLFIKKARYVSSNQIIFALISNEVILYDLVKKDILWKRQINTSRFSDFVLNKDKTKMALADESGEMFLVNIKDGKLLKTFSGQNVDNIFQVDYKNSVVTGAGQDRRVSMYSAKNTKASYKKSKFIVYSVGLSPSANLTAYSANEENDIFVMNTQTHSNIANLIGHKSIISKILFKNESEIFTASDDQYIYYWKIN